MFKKITIFFILPFVVCNPATVFSGNPGFLFQDDNKHISVVVLDPGHGGKDTGAAVGDDTEKEIVLDLALKLGDLIKSKYPGIKVVYTRKTDVFIPLIERARIANKNKADLFISIHVNGAESTSPFGTETFVLGEDRLNDNFDVVKKENSVILLEDDYHTTYEGYDPNSPESNIMFLAVQSEYQEQSIILASAIQDQFRTYAKRYDRSVKQAGFLVLRQVIMPSVLIETGFITHSGERSYLTSETGKSTLTVAIFNAFQDYKRKIESKSSFNMRVESVEMVRSVAEMAKETHAEEDAEKEKPAQITEPSTNIYFSVQIAASKKKVDPIPANFKGVKNVFVVKTGDLFKYYAGKFQNIDEAKREKRNIEKKYPEAFEVAFENNQIISVKKALEKM